MSEMTVEPGVGATYSVGSDSYPCTVKEVHLFKSGARKGEIRSVAVTRDNHVWNESTKDFDYIPDPDSSELWFDRKKNRLVSGSSVYLSIGTRRYYQDPHF